jgi:hypothetical protein
VNRRATFSLVVLFIVIVIVIPLTESLTGISVFAREYYNTDQLASLQNECSSGDGTSSCANNNAETLGDENIMSQGMGQSYPTKTGGAGTRGPFASQDLVHVIWADNTHGNSDILYRKSSETFAQSTLNLSTNEEDSSRPAIAVSGSDIHLVWSDRTADGSDIMYRKSTDGGATFGSTINLSNNLGNSINAAIAISSNDVYIVWSDNTLGNNEIFYTKSTNGGATFGNIINLSNSPGSSNSPSIAVSGDDVHVVWGEFVLSPRDVDIRYQRSTDGGASFGPVQILNDDLQDSGSPGIAVSGKNVYVVWQEDFPGADEIFYKRSMDRGTTFENTVNLSSNPTGSEGPAIASSGKNVYVVWRDAISGNLEIAFSHSSDGGGRFGPVQDLSNTIGSSVRPAIATNNHNVYVVWEDFTGTPDEFNSVHSDIIFRLSNNNGASFGSSINLSSNAGDSSSPDIAASHE